MWIRNQDRTSLINCNDFTINKALNFDAFNIIANYKYLEGQEQYDILGFYSSNEKALKVLNRIEYRIAVTTKQQITPFQMPQDNEV